MYVLGIDFGGGASKATLLSSSGTVVCTAQTEYPTYYSADGAAKQNPHDWFDAAVKNISAILKKVPADQIKCICFDAATHTAVLLDSDSEVIINSIHWTDTRSKAEKQWLLDNYGEQIFDKCLHYPDTIWTLPQLMYIQKKQPEKYAKTVKVMFAKDYVRSRFTGDFLTDHIEAEGSMLYDMNEQKWSTALLNLAGLDISQMPKLKRPMDIAGGVTKQAARLTGLKAGTPIIVGTTDTAAEMFASGATDLGHSTIKLATAGRICALSDKPYPDRHIINYSYIKSGLYYPGSATKSAAASYRWLRDAFGVDYKELDSLAATVSAGADGLIFHPYLNGELTPLANSNLRGSFIGLNGGHTKAHFARAVLEGVCYSMLDCKNYLNQKGIDIGGSFIIGGGAKSPLWRRILSDTLAVELSVTSGSDSSLGSAMLAGIAAGFFENMQSAAKLCCRILDVTVPDLNNNEIYLKQFERYKYIQRALGQIYGED